MSVSRRCPPGQKLARDGTFRLVRVPLVLVPLVPVLVVLVPVLDLDLDLPLERLLFSLIRSLLISKPASLLDLLVLVPVLDVRVVPVLDVRVVLVVLVVPVLVVLVPVVLVPVVLVPSVLSSAIAGITSTHSQSQVTLFCFCKALHSRPLVGHSHSQVPLFRTWALVQVVSALAGQMHRQVSVSNA